MDAIDLKLLDVLQQDSRVTNQEIGERIGLSASQCSRRRAALEEAGVIRGYGAILSAEALGLDVLVLIHVTVATHTPDNAARFADLVNRLDEVLETYSITGESDYVVKVAVRNLRALSALLSDVFLPHPSVAHLRSSIVLDKVKERNTLPLRLSPPRGEQGRRR